MKRFLQTKLSWQLLLFLGFFFIHTFLQFYDIEKRTSFTWDQVDNAWMAKNILIDKKYPFVGMVAKGNSGFYIGPAYYYFATFFYMLTDLDPIASGIIAGVSSMFTFCVLFYVAKKIFSYRVAFVAVFIYTFSFFIITSDRVQWPVSFIPPISLMIFYCLYKITSGSYKFIPLLATTTGISFHIHFTSIFYIIIILASLPLFPRKRETFYYILLSLPLFIVWFIPNILAEFQTKGTSSKNLSSYIHTYYHGLHVTRVKQLLYDAFIEFESILHFKIFRPVTFLFVPLFALVLYKSDSSKEKLRIIYLFSLWFLTPWIIFSVYRGEISDYYFSLTRLFVVIALSYLSIELFSMRNVVTRILIVGFWLYYAWFNLSLFFEKEVTYNLYKHRTEVRTAIQQGQMIPFTEGDPKSFLYYLHTRNQ